MPVHSMEARIRAMGYLTFRRRYLAGDKEGLCRDLDCYPSSLTRHIKRLGLPDLKEQKRLARVTREPTRLV